MRVRVHNHLDDLTADLAKIPVTAAKKWPGIVKRNVSAGNSTARRFAREKSGPHGLNYYKRITAEMTGPLTGEYGPTGDVVENAVGAGWRNGPQNTDLPRSADIIGPKFAQDVSDAVDRLFW